VSARRRLRAAVVAAYGVIIAGCGLGTAGPAAAQGPGPAPARLYVANQDAATVSVLDVATNTAVATLDLRTLGFAANARPHHTQVEPDGRFWYVTLIGAGKVLKLDRDNRVVASAAMEVPGLMALHPTEDLLVVGRSMSAVNPPSRLVVLKRSDMSVVDEIDVFFPRPHALVWDTRGERVFVASLGQNQLASVGVRAGEVKLVDVPGPAHSFTQAAVSPDGRWMVLTAQLTSQLAVFDVANPAEPKLLKMIPLEKGPFEPAFTPDGKWVYVTDLDANRISVVDAGSWEVAATLTHPALAQPHGVAVSPDGRVVYVSNRHQSGGAHDHEGGKATGQGTVVAICVATRQVIAVVPAGAYAAGISTPVPARRPASPPGPCS
jgi:YVTN family beta-propeller protein